MLRVSQSLTLFRSMREQITFDQWEKRKFEENHAGNDTFQSDFDGIIPVVFDNLNGPSSSQVRGFLIETVKGKHLINQLGSSLKLKRIVQTASL